ncbi:MULTISPECIES: oxalyl-CoA decarboxylase [Providencia]|uniref:Oxalyl-CoA decarboxylase n=2 Tax=Providencia rustigianii TaxID=158850 RepID=D1P666_9GAMM|nr:MULTISPECIES: oxalyl-CoA decarboxylase [Providencia]EFB71189.1 oxalyl-CoA decarboxylase [Providencia rustigianii DSM 4541]MTC55729.1 oxalyl-CoA decarboxylase [Providencia rustigianii]SPY76656.1 Probable oxalyl-CoA decarboxylase [Providencia rustigianii]SUC25883.1 Probable oxalyl-CoA decarboxylase [Providencia rustigianii]SUC34610.1 Probable oxalyl-CoA decarboxylase [Providencia rustigianii]
MSTNQNQNLTDGMHIIIDALKKNDIDTIYGVVGIPVTDMARHAQAVGIRYIGFRHEQSAGNAAAISGYITQKPGICLTVSAPGFLNGMVALANATTNGFPMIQISGSSNRAIIDLQQGDYEELDQMNIAKPFVKASYRVNKPEDLGIALARAIRTSVSGRPGGVYLDLTTEVLAAVMDKDEADKTIFKVEDPAPKQLPSPYSIKKALQLLASAKQPLIILGKGAAYAQADEKIRQFVEETGIPYLPMSMAKGLLPDNHPQSAASARSYALSNADVVVLMGARLNWLLDHGKGKHWSPDTQFIQLDIEPTEIDSNRPISAPIVGDIDSSVEALLTGLKSIPVKSPNEWLATIDEHKKVNVEKMATKLNTDTSPMNYFNALRAIRDVLVDHKDVYVVNEGANTLDNARNIIDMYQPRKRLDCGTWGVMGVGMGYAVGASVTSGIPVVAIEGDSAFGFSGMEIETICRYKLPVTILIFNNGGIYRGDDKNLHGDTDPSPTVLMADARYDKMIEAFGGIGYYATTPQEIQQALKKGITSRSPTLINVIIDPAVGTESGHIGNLNPKSVAGN